MFEEDILNSERSWNYDMTELMRIGAAYEHRMGDH